jgi:hypothetical protein
MLFIIYFAAGPHGESKAVLREGPGHQSGSEAARSQIELPGQSAAPTARSNAARRQLVEPGGAC